MMEPPIHILITDDHAVVREGLRSLLTLKPDMEVVGEAADGVEAVQQAQALQPDVILLDLVMPRQDGLAALRPNSACPSNTNLTGMMAHNPPGAVLVKVTPGQGAQLSVGGGMA